MGPSCQVESKDIKLKETIPYNEGKLVARFCHQVAAQVPDMFCNFYLVKSHKIANNSATTEAREKNKHRFGIDQTPIFLFNENVSMHDSHKVLMEVDDNSALIVGDP